MPSTYVRELVFSAVFQIILNGNIAIRACFGVKNLPDKNIEPMFILASAVVYLVSMMFILPDFQRVIYELLNFIHQSLILISIQLISIRNHYYNYYWRSISFICGKNEIEVSTSTWAHSFRLRIENIGAIWIYKE